MESDQEVRSKSDQIPELEIYLLAREIADLKAKIQETLKNYKVPNLETLEQQIADGHIPEHPTYEEYLSALTFQVTMMELSEQLAGKIRELITI